MLPWLLELLRSPPYRIVLFDLPDLSRLVKTRPFVFLATMPLLSLLFSIIEFSDAKLLSLRIPSPPFIWNYVCLFWWNKFVPTIFWFLLGPDVAIIVLLFRPELFEFSVS